jgi:Na+-transporting methylmalonyl-CoA/oxaloacetate decarboxylase gamma subunit
MSPLPASALPPLGFLPEYPTVLETLGYQVVGLAVVFTALGLIWLLLEAMGMWFRRAAVRAAQPAATPAIPPPAAPEPSQPAPPDKPPVAVIIAAAVHTALGGRRHRVVSITAAPDHQAWSVEGRRHIFSSHKVR